MIEAFQSAKNLLENTSMRSSPHRIKVLEGRVCPSYLPGQLALSQNHLNMENKVKLNVTVGLWEWKTYLVRRYGLFSAFKKYMYNWHKTQFLELYWELDALILLLSYSNLAKAFNIPGFIDVIEPCFS